MSKSRLFVLAEVLEILIELLIKTALSLAVAAIFLCVAWNITIPLLLPEYSMQYLQFTTAYQICMSGMFLVLTGKFIIYAVSTEKQ
jgi:hypothetical protein